MGFLGKLESVNRVLQRPFRMPVCRREISFFIMFGGGTMRLRGKFVLFGGFSVFLVHDVRLWKR
jgi:hypothetical protein